MNELTLPTQFQIESLSARRAHISIQPLHPGFGITLGNALRRVLLSSLPGGAITAIKIKGVKHEFSVLSNMKEDVVDVILNLKSLRLKSLAYGPVKLVLDMKGEKVVKAKDIEKNAQVEILDLDHYIATLTSSDAELKMEMWVENGRGYDPVEGRVSDRTEVGVIEIDALFSPVRLTNFTVENMRVGQLTNYNKLMVDIETDGSVTPLETFQSAAKILVTHFQLFMDVPGLSVQTSPVQTPPVAEIDSIPAVSDESHESVSELKSTKLFKKSKAGGKASRKKKSE